MPKALIVGGGIGGITAALALAAQQVDVELIEQADELGEVGAGIQLSPNCLRVLDHLGLGDALTAQAFVPEGVELRSWQSGATIRRNPLGSAVVDTFGFPYFHMHRADLMAVLAKAAEAHARINLRLSTRVLGVRQDDHGVTLHTSAGATHGDFLIGADGIHSVVRAELWGADSARFTGCVAWRSLVDVRKLPAGLIRPMSTAWLGPGGHFVHYYVRGGTLVNCVCVIEKDGWEVESWTERGDKAELLQDFAGWHDDLQTLMDHIERDNLYRWALHDREPMPRWGQGRVTLLGDACHPTLPFMAQGAAMAIEDGAVLAACLRRDADIAAALAEYEDLRRERTAGIQLGSRRNATVFHLSGEDAAARDRAMQESGEAFPVSLYGYNALDPFNSGTGAS